MIGVGIRVMMVVVVVVMSMVVVGIVVTMTRVMSVMNVRLGVAMRGGRSACSDALDVVVMTALRQTDFCLEAEYLSTIFAKAAVHVVFACDDLLDPLDERVDHQRMIVEIRRLDEFDLWMIASRSIHGVIDALDQYSGEQEVGKYDDPGKS